MKILFLTEYFPSTQVLDIHGGVELRVYKIAKYLSKYHDVVVFASWEKDKPKFQLIGKLVIKRVGWIRDYAAFGKYPKILTRIVFITAIIFYGLKENFDLVEGNGHICWFPAWILAKIKRRKGIALVADIADQSLSPYLSSWTFLLVQTMQYLLLKVPWNLYVCISETVRNKLIKMGIPKNKIQLLYCGTDVKSIRKLKVSKNLQKIICVSRLVNYKRVDDLIRAFKLVEEKIPQARLEIIGIGDEIVSLKKMVIDFQLTDKAYFLGFVPSQIEVWRKIKSAGIFCLPSEVEGFGIATVEAMAAGVPVVLPDIPINREITRNHGVLFYKSSDFRDLSRQLIRLMTNKKKYKKLTIDLKKLAQTYDWSNIGAQTQKIYESLCIN